MKKLARFLPLGLVILGTSAFADDPTITLPTPDYTNFYAVVGLALGVGLTFAIAKNMKRFVKSI